MSIVDRAKSRGIVLAEERTDLAVQRTMSAAERTLMAWIRTTISMIGFGFSSYQFFQYQAEEIAAGNIRHPQAPRNLGMTLVAIRNSGIIDRTAWQHRNLLQEIGAPETRHVLSISFVVALAVILLETSRFTVLCCAAVRSIRDATFARNPVANPRKSRTISVRAVSFDSYADTMMTIASLSEGKAHEMQEQTRTS